MNCLRARGRKTIVVIALCASAILLLHHYQPINRIANQSDSEFPAALRALKDKVHRFRSELEQNAREATTNLRRNIDETLLEKSQQLQANPATNDIKAAMPEALQSIPIQPASPASPASSPRTPSLFDAVAHVTTPAPSTVHPDAQSLAIERPAVHTETDHEDHKNPVGPPASTSKSTKPESNMNVPLTPAPASHQTSAELEKQSHDKFSSLSPSTDSSAHAAPSSLKATTITTDLTASPGSNSLGSKSSSSIALPAQAQSQLNTSPPKHPAGPLTTTSKSHENQSDTAGKLTSTSGAQATSSIGHANFATATVPKAPTAKSAVTQSSNSIPQPHSVSSTSSAPKINTNAPATATKATTPANTPIANKSGAKQLVPLPIASRTLNVVPPKSPPTLLSSVKKTIATLSAASGTKVTSSSASPISKDANSVNHANASPLAAQAHSKSGSSTPAPAAQGTALKPKAPAPSLPVSGASSSAHPPANNLTVRSNIDPLHSMKKSTLDTSNVNAAPKTTSSSTSISASATAAQIHPKPAPIDSTIAKPISASTSNSSPKS